MSKFAGCKLYLNSILSDWYFTALCKRWEKNVKQTVPRVLMPVLFISDIQRVYILDNTDHKLYCCKHIFALKTYATVLCLFAHRGVQHI
jgi:hypothetical protein